MAWVWKTLHRPRSIAPLAVFRMLYGFMMLWSMLRFLAKGWVSQLYVEPAYYFPFKGFEWVQPLGAVGMHALFGLLALSALAIMLGWHYRLFAWIFALGFTYVELIDKTHYLNHYYFISVLAFMMALLPAQGAWSLDARKHANLASNQIPSWMILVLQLQLAIVYFYAGLAKLHPDWLFHALPLRIWLPPLSDIPLIGWLMPYKTSAYVFSWAGAIYDLSIPFLLWWQRSRPLAYLAVICFHVLTWLLFPIGMFPWIMILATLIFFPAKFHENLLRQLKKGLQWLSVSIPNKRPPQIKRPTNPWLLRLFALHIAIQLLLPWRHLLYPGELFWHEQGFRFSWRVMLMEKNGTAFFTVRDPLSGREWEPIISDFLSPRQEKMMATQPDMILQTAHLLKNHYAATCACSPAVFAQVFVSLNGRRNKPFINPAVDLGSLQSPHDFRTWVLPYPYSEPTLKHD